jgi:multidrug efflux pump subunit AcrA (membrane-fusion protein)
MLRVGEEHRAAVVPVAAVQRWDQGEFVFLPRPGPAYDPRWVRTRPIEGGDEVEIIEGVEPGEQVVVAGIYRL